MMLASIEGGVCDFVTDVTGGIGGKRYRQEQGHEGRPLCLEMPGENPRRWQVRDAYQSTTPGGRPPGGWSGTFPKGPGPVWVGSREMGANWAMRIGTG